MAVELGTFVLLMILSIVTIVFSSMVLAYTGYINSRGSDEQKRAMPKVRIGLLWSASILLVLAVATLIVGAVQFNQGRSSGSASSQNLQRLVSGL